MYNNFSSKYANRINLSKIITNTSLLYAKITGNLSGYNLIKSNIIKKYGIYTDGLLNYTESNRNFSGIISDYQQLSNTGDISANNTISIGAEFIASTVNTQPVALIIEHNTVSVANYTTALSNMGFTVITDTLVTTVQEVAAYNPDLILGLKVYWAFLKKVTYLIHYIIVDMPSLLKGMIQVILFYQ